MKHVRRAEGYGVDGAGAATLEGLAQGFGDHAVEEVLHIDLVGLRLKVDIQIKINFLGHGLEEALVMERDLQQGAQTAGVKEPGSVNFMDAFLFMPELKVRSRQLCSPPKGWSRNKT